MNNEQFRGRGSGIRGQELPLVPTLLPDIGGSLKCSYVLASLGFSDEDFVDYRGLMGLKKKCS